MPGKQMQILRYAQDDTILGWRTLLLTPKLPGRGRCGSNVERRGSNATADPSTASIAFATDFAQDDSAWGGRDFARIWRSGRVVAYAVRRSSCSGWTMVRLAPRMEIH